MFGISGGGYSNPRAAVILHVLFWIVIGTILAGCSSKSPWPGVSLSSSGEIEIYSKICDERAIGYVYLREESPTVTSLGSRSAGPIVWEARALGRGSGVVTVTNSLPGYEILTPLADRVIDPNKVYSFHMDDEEGVSMQGVLLKFSPSELDGSVVKWTNGVVPKAQWFDKSGPPPCV